MAHRDKRRQAIILRKQGKSYSQIKTELKVSKSTLSVWLKELPLDPTRLKELRDFSHLRIENYRNTMRKKREQRLSVYYNEEKSNWIPLSKRELYLAGLFLYWGEGDKANRGTVSINNTDPMLMKFALYWLVECLEIPKEKIKVNLHLYDDMKILEEMNFWSQELNMPKVNFAKPYIKKSTRTSLDQKGFGHGTCGLRVFNTVLKEHLMMALKAISDNYGSKIGEI